MAIREHDEAAFRIADEREPFTPEHVCRFGEHKPAPSGSRCIVHSSAPATAARPDRPAAGHHRRPRRGVADPEPFGDPRQRQTVRVQRGGLSALVRQEFRLPRCDTRPASNLAHRPAVDAEPRRQLPDGHTLHVAKARRAEFVAGEIVAAGGSASTVAADISNPTDCVDLVAHLSKDFQRLDALILNASGGLELGADPGYSMRINRDAPVRLVQLAMPLMPAGGRIVFVTSHQAHFHGAKPVPAKYVPIAENKRAGEDALRAMRPEFASRDIDFTVVSGDIIDGTIIVRYCSDVIPQRSPPLEHTVHYLRWSSLRRR